MGTDCVKVYNVNSGGVYTWDCAPFAQSLKATIRKLRKLLFDAAGAGHGGLSDLLANDRARGVRFVVVDNTTRLFVYVAYLV